MNSHAYVNKFFADLGLSLVRDDGSDSLFENFVSEACAPDFCIRVERDRNSEMVEVRARGEAKEWFDLTIVMTLMLNESKLFQEIDVKEQLEFVKTNFDDLAQMFATSKYREVLPQLKALELQRARIRFPDWYS